MINMERFTANAARCGVPVTAEQAALLDRYAALLVEYNEKVNLTAITDPQGIEDKHFIDSLLLAVQPEAQGRLVDVGTGAGFPGVVAKLYRPELRLTLLEPTGKRLDFLRWACGELGVEAEFLKERAEEAARKQWRERFDTATARAVARLNKLAEYCLPLVRVGGYFLAMKAESAAEELQEARPAIERLGGEVVGLRRFSLPEGDERGIIIVKKISQTPTVYPRNGGKIAKSPLK